MDFNEQCSKVAYYPLYRKIQTCFFWLIFHILHVYGLLRYMMAMYQRDVSKMHFKFTVSRFLQSIDTKDRNGFPGGLSSDARIQTTPKQEAKPSRRRYSSIRSRRRGMAKQNFFFRCVPGCPPFCSSKGINLNI
ncbi:hypothetical protein B9Z55_002853 [Caenorhabditis nigoni]|uniref:Uncharacterized protein n=1 Tax=Caenorhabditis nigoni TaxID=1611254 RepID=A0A2G5VMF5_9PELO|nr:hypothetical protein B9Z55_002853 [Caenorhabditis nigoni]